MQHLNWIDITIMVLYVLFIVWYGLSKGKSDSSDDYFLSGRNIAWPIVGISLIAANISSNTLIGLAGDAYLRGVGVYNYEWMAAVVLVIFGMFLLPFYLQSKIYTVPEFLERRFDARSRYYFSGVTLLLNIVVDTASALFASGIVLNLIFPGISMFWWSGILALAAAAYTIPGGLSSVVHTEAIQGVLLLVCACILSVIVYQDAGGWQHVLDVMHVKRADVGSDMLSVWQSSSSKNIPWTGMVFGIPILGFYFWATNQFMVQRMLSAKDLNNGRWGALLAGLLKLPVIFIMVLPGIMALALPDNLFDHALAEKVPNNVYPQLVLNLLPTGLRGLVLAGMIAALSSHISATMNSCATLVTMDFVSKWNPSLSNEKLVRYGKIAALIVCILSWIWVPIIFQFKSLFEYLQLVLSLICPPVVAVFLVGLFWRRANGQGAFYGLMSGVAMMMYILFTNIGLTKPDGYGAFFYIFGSWIHFLNVAPFLLLLTALVTIVVSSMSAPPDYERIDKYIWTTDVWKKETIQLRGLVWYKNYRVLSVILLIITAITVGMFIN